MKQILVTLTMILVLTVSLEAQNVGINETNPQHALHVKPVSPSADPIRIENLNYYMNSDTTVLVQDMATGIIRYMTFGDLKLQLGSSGGDISGVIAGAGLTGGGTSGTPTLTAAANNGITVDPTADRIQWGGALTESTTITQGIYSTLFNLNGTGDFIIRDNGVNRFAVLDNGRTAVGGTITAGQFNVTGNSFFSDDLWLRDGTVNSGDYLLRLYDSADDGVIDIYRNNAVINRFHGNGNSFVNGGNFGIGTSSPSQKLHVIGTGRFSDLAGVGNRMVVANLNGILLTQPIPIGDITGITAGYGLIGGGGTGSPIISAEANNGITVDFLDDKIQWGGRLTENTTVWNGQYSTKFNLDGSGDFYIQDNHVDVFAVLDNGRTTVGGTASAATFNVTGESYFSDNLTLRDGSVVSGDTLLRLYDTYDDGVIDVYQNNVVKNRINGNGDSYFTGGNLGLGTNTPTHQLEVIASEVQNGSFIELTKTGAGAGRALLTESISHYTLGKSTGVLSSASSGLGVTTWETTGGRFEAGGVARRQYGVYATSDGTGADIFAYGILANVANPNYVSGAKYAGYFGGNVYTTGSYLPSYRALKQNIQLASPAISKLMQLQVKSYEYKTSEFQEMNLPEGEQTGFMADEMKQVYPGLVKKAVHPSDDSNPESSDIEFEAVNYTGLIPDLVKGTQEQQTEIESLKQKLQDQDAVLIEIKAQNKALKATLEQIKSSIANMKEDR